MVTCPPRGAASQRHLSAPSSEGYCSPLGEMDRMGSQCRLRRRRGGSGELRSTEQRIAQIHGGAAPNLGCPPRRELSSLFRAHDSSSERGLGRLCEEKNCLQPLSWAKGMTNDRSAT